MFKAKLLLFLLFLYYPPRSCFSISGTVLHPASYASYSAFIQQTFTVWLHIRIFARDWKFRSEQAGMNLISWCLFFSARGVWDPPFPLPSLTKVSWSPTNSSFIVPLFRLQFLHSYSLLICLKLVFSYSCHFLSSCSHNFIFKILIILLINFPASSVVPS